jgi:hypothetical protein
MIEQVLRSINNFYIRTASTISVIEVDGITVSKPAYFMREQYIFVQGSVVNDGVYKVHAIVGSKLITDEALIPEVVACTIYGLAIPKALLDVIVEIQAYNGINPNGINQESLGDYSVSYAGLKGGGDLSWSSVFRVRLKPYTKAYLNFPRGEVIDDDRYWFR